MSHNSLYKANIKDVQALKDVCARLGIPCTIFEQAKEITLYGSNKVMGIARIDLPGWAQPIAITKDGQVYYDNFGAKDVDDISSMDRLGMLCQGYNEVVIHNDPALAEMDNYYVNELENGDKEFILEFA